MTIKMNLRRFLGVGVFAGAAPFAALAVLMPARAEPAPVPLLPTALVSPATPELVSVFGDSITHSVAPDNHVTAVLEDGLQMSWNTKPGVTTDHFQNGFDEAGVNQPDVVLIATGTNDSVAPIGAVHAASIDNALDALAENPCVVWVNVRSEIWWTHPVAWNHLLEEKAATAGNVRVADWDGYSTGHPEWISYDAVHLSDEGQVAYAKWLVDQVVLGCPEIVDTPQ